MDVKCCEKLNCYFQKTHFLIVILYETKLVDMRKLKIKTVLLLLLLLSLCFLTVQLSAQSKRISRFGFEYGLEKVFYSEDNNKDIKCFYVKNFKAHKGTMFYKLPLYKGLYLEPQISFYHMDYEREFDILFTPKPGVFTFDRLELYKFNENGLGGCLHLGYNFSITDKISLDAFIAPDYRYALSSRGGFDEAVDLLADYSNDYEDFGPIYKQDYFILKGGIGVNYGVLSLKVDYGRYITNRFNIIEDARRPQILSFSLGVKFVL